MKLTKGNFFQLFSLVAVAGLLTFTGCSDDPSNPNNTSDDSITKPSVGSEFVYNEYDTTDDQKIDSTEQTVTITVMEAGLTYQGKSEVYRLREDYEKSDDVDRHIRYEANNDVAVYFDETEIPFGDPLWLTLPFGSKSEHSWTLIDTLIKNDSCQLDTLRVVITTAYVGEETVQYNGSDLKVWVATTTVNGTIPFPIIRQVSISVVSTMKFAPSLGFVYSTVEKSDDGGTSNVQEGSVQTLISHTLK